MGYSMLLSVLILLSCFILVANQKVKSYIRTFRLQSILIAIAAGFLGFENISNQEGIDILIMCGIIVALKVIYIPRLLLKTFDKVKCSVEKDYFYNIPLLEIICSLIVVFCYFVLPKSGLAVSGDMSVYLVNSVSVILIGMLFMISRKKAIGQIVGFLVIENGLFITAMYSTHGMPLIIDLGIFIDLITAVLIMGMMVFRIDREFDSIDINKMKNLRG